MKTLADLKRKMVKGSVWHAFHALHGNDMGVREVSRVNSQCVYFWTERDGRRFESRFDWPKSSELEFEGNSVKVIHETKYDGSVHYLTYTAV